MLPGGIGSQEMIIFLVIAVLLFGSKLPEVMRNLGKVYSQFRRSLTDFQFQVEDMSPRSGSVTERPVSRITSEDDDDEPKRKSAPRFHAPPADDE